MTGAAVAGFQTVLAFAHNDDGPRPPGGGLWAVVPWKKGHGAMSYDSSSIIRS